jgi:hypothetical protein
MTTLKDKFINTLSKGAKAVNTIMNPGASLGSYIGNKIASNNQKPLAPVVNTPVNKPVVTSNLGATNPVTKTNTLPPAGRAFVDTLSNTGSSPMVNTSTNTNNTPNIPTPAPVEDKNAKYTNAYQKYIDSLKESPEVATAKTKYNDFITKRDTSLQNIQDQTIPLNFITGQQESVANRANIEAGRLERNVASAEATQKATTESLKAGVDLEGKILDQNKPVEVGGVLYQPQTDGTYKPITTKEKEAFNLSEGQSRYEVNPLTGKYEKVASVGKTYAPGSGGGGSTSGGITQAVIANPALYSTLTPTVKGQVIREMQSQGIDTTSLTIPQLNNTQREQIDSFDTMKREAQLAKTYLESGLNTGPIASRLSKGSAVLGGSKDFTNYRSSIDNLGSILIKARSGAAVTPQEFERIKGFIPGVNDDEKTATTKIDRFFTELEAAQNNYIKRATQTPQQIANTSTSSGGADPLGIR